MSEPPKTYRLWSAIATISAVLQRKCYFQWGALTFYPNMYIILIGPPAARKGTAMDQARPFLEKLDIKMAAEAITREALIRELSEATDNTMVGDKMYFHSSLTIWAQELTVFLGYSNLQLMSDLTDWYDCKNRWTYRTKGQGVDDITGVYVVLFGATTPDLIRSALPLDAIGGGLTSRMIFIYEPNKEKLVPLTELDKALGKQLLNDLRQIQLLGGRFTYHKDFSNKWIDWYVAQEGHPPFRDSKFAGYIDRRAPHILKLCIVSCASRTDDMIITVEDLERAISILELTEQKMAQTFSGVGKSPHAEVMAKIMTDIGLEKEIEQSDLLERYYNDVDKWTLGKIIDTLEETKFLVRISGTPGKTILLHRATLDKKEKEDE